MKITPELFAAHLECPTKCWLKSVGQHGTGNGYAEWIERQNEAYRRIGVERLNTTFSVGEQVMSPPLDKPKEAKWRLALDIRVQTDKLQTRIHAVERLPCVRGKWAEFVPTRFVFRNHLTREDKLLLAFDAFVLSEFHGRQVNIGKIIHGNEHTALRVKIPALTSKVQKTHEKIEVLVAGKTAPDLILNRHCPECEFRDSCRQKALEKDDLSLLAGMRADERKEYNQRGLFTVTQLSYTFRPRRRPKHLREKREKYHHALKALAIREKKIYVVGIPTYQVEGTPVYLDVESLPDQDFYYLIGARVKTPAGFVQHSFWADDVPGTARIWRDFLALLATLDNPRLIHYGSFEKTFLKQMRDRYGGPPTDAAGAIRAVEQPVNLVSTIFAQIYFPTLSNTLKEVASFLGFKWSEPNVSGLSSVVWREAWNSSKSSETKQRLIRYNAEDCEALVVVESIVSRLAGCEKNEDAIMPNQAETVNTDDLRHPLMTKWEKFESPISELEFVTKAAHWDYQRDRIYVRTSKPIRRLKKKPKRTHKQVWRVDKVVWEKPSPTCPICHTARRRKGVPRHRTVQEMIFGRFSLKRRVIRHYYQTFWCRKCKMFFGVEEKLLRPGKPRRYGQSLRAYIMYQAIELYIPMQVIATSMNRLFGLDLDAAACKLFKAALTEYYGGTNEKILQRIISGPLVHADETFISVRGTRAYVWVFTNMHEVAYIYSQTREGGLAQVTLEHFKGVLVSDFYAVYDSMRCPQQKCLIHLIRDLNGSLLDNPYDGELNRLVKSFGELLKRIVEEIDRRGLKAHFLRKYLRDVDLFYRREVRRVFQSPAAQSCAERFERNREKLFTFLSYDGVPWNNNNAEHAMKAFARLRDQIAGTTTEKGLKEYLVLLSICLTCKYQGLDFLDFLRSGERDIEVFAQVQRNGRRRSKPEDAPVRVPDSASADQNVSPLEEGIR